MQWLSVSVTSPPLLKAREPLEASHKAQMHIGLGSMVVSVSI
jgi:hypothetical protein